jgi:hypothetical protein
LPKRFKAKPSHSQPAVILTDTQTNRQVEVPIHGYSLVRHALINLFPD